MENIKELVKEYVTFKYELHKKYLDLKYTATGQYLLDEISEDELNIRLHFYSNGEAIDCKVKLYEIAVKSGIPLAIWCVDNLPTHIALYVIRRLPMYADELDELALRNNWCDDYQHYRAFAIKSGALIQRDQ